MLVKNHCETFAHAVNTQHSSEMNMEAIRAALQEWRDMLENQRREEEELKKKTNEFLRRYIRKEKAFLRSLPTIRRIKMKKPLNKCPICLEDIVPIQVVRFRTRSSYAGRIAQTVQCNHKFHLCCIEEWLRNSLTCPVCRSPVAEDGGVDITDA